MDGIDRSWTDEIVNEILRRLQISNQPIVTGQILALCGETISGWREGIHQLRRLEKSGYDIRKAYSPRVMLLYQKLQGTAEAIDKPDFSEEDYWRAEEILDETDLVVLPVLPVNVISKVMAGFQEDLIQTLLAESLYRGTPIIAGEKYSPNDNGGYLAGILRGRIEEFQQAGGIVVPVKELADRAALMLSPSRFGMEADEAAPNGERYASRILCREDLAKIVGKKILLDDDTIVSPEVMDIAREDGIELIKKGRDIARRQQ